jgi:hypothetical protein
MLQNFVSNIRNLSEEKLNLEPRSYHGGDYEECRLLGYENPVRTSQETHYVSAMESNRLMLCKI